MYKPYNVNYQDVLLRHDKYIKGKLLVYIEHEKELLQFYIQCAYMLSFRFKNVLFKTHAHK